METSKDRSNTPLSLKLLEQSTEPLPFRQSCGEQRLRLVQEGLSGYTCHELLDKERTIPCTSAIGETELNMTVEHRQQNNYKIKRYLQEFGSNSMGKSLKPSCTKGGLG